MREKLYILNAPTDIEENERISKEIDRLAKKRKITIKHEGSMPFEMGGIGVSPFSGTLQITIGDLILATDDVRRNVTLLHELGHYEDYANRGISWADYARLESRWSPEVNAWEYGVILGKEIGFTEWDVYFEHMMECLSTYSEDSEECAKREAMEMRYKYFGIRKGRAE